MPHRRNRRVWGREGLNCFFSEGLGFKHQSNFLEHDFIQHIKFRTSGVLFLLFDFHAHEQGRTQGVCQGQSPTLVTHSMKLLYVSRHPIVCAQKMGEKVHMQPLHMQKCATSPMPSSMPPVLCFKVTVFPFKRILILRSRATFLR